MNQYTAPLTGLLLTLGGTANAAPVVMDFTATVQIVSGSFNASLSTSQSITGTYIFDTDENNASYSETTPSNVPGHEFTSFYDFTGAPYSTSLSATGFSFSNTAPVGVVVNNDLALTAAETNGAVTDGVYDWIEILGSTTTDVGGPHTPGNGQEWTLALIAGDNNWFTDGSVVPDNLPASYTPILVGADFDSAGTEAGFVFGAVDSITVSSVPVPASVWLFGSGLLGLVSVARRRKAD